MTKEEEEEEKKVIIDSNNNSFKNLFLSVDQNLKVVSNNIERAIRGADEYCTLIFAEYISSNTINKTLLKEIVDSLHSQIFSSLGRIQVFENEDNTGIIVYWGPTCRKYSNLKELK